MKKFTNTLKLTHRIEQNTSKISYLDEEEFHTPHAHSLQIFYLCPDLKIHKTKKIISSSKNLLIE
jgi:hypothetical protein